MNGMQVHCRVTPSLPESTHLNAYTWVDWKMHGERRVFYPRTWRNSPEQGFNLNCLVTCCVWQLMSLSTTYLQKCYLPKKRTNSPGTFFTWVVCFPMTGHVLSSRELFIYPSKIYSVIYTQLFENLKPRILKSIIMWSVHCQQTAQSKKVYSLGKVRVC